MAHWAGNSGDTIQDEHTWHTGLQTQYRTYNQVHNLLTQHSILAVYKVHTIQYNNNT